MNLKATNSKHPLSKQIPFAQQKHQELSQNHLPLNGYGSKPPRATPANIQCIPKKASIRYLFCKKPFKTCEETKLQGGLATPPNASPRSCCEDAETVFQQSLQAIRALGQDGRIFCRCFFGLIAVGQNPYRSS